MKKPTLCMLKNEKRETRILDQFMAASSRTNLMGDIREAPFADSRVHLLFQLVVQNARRCQWMEQETLLHIEESLD